MLATRALGARVAVEPPQVRRASRAVVWALAATPPLAQLLFLLLKDQPEWFKLFSDDAFYYFGVARSLATGDGSSFTGLTETNGYHPLWTSSLAALATVARTPAAFVVVVVVLQNLIWIGVVREGMRIGRALGSEASAAIGLAALGFLAVLTGQLSFSGMESAPLLFFLLVAIRIILEAEEKDRRADWWLGLACALAFLSRLDSILTVGPLVLLVLLAGNRSLPILARRLVATAGPTAVSLVVYVAVNQWFFGTPTPVSGQAKALGADGLNWTPLMAALKAGKLDGRSLWFGALTITVFALVALSRVWRSTETLGRLFRCAIALLVGQALLSTYLVVGTAYPIWPWYHYNLALLAFCTTLLAAAWLAPWLGRLASPSYQLVGLGFCLAVLPAGFWTTFTNSTVSVEAAEFVHEEIPEDAVIAMGDRAGLFGYLADRPMLQLEGLMADAEWLDNMSDGTELDRMRAEGVEYYVWYGFHPGDPVFVGDKVCRVFHELPNAAKSPFDVTVCDVDMIFDGNVEGHWLRIWRYRPELNPR